MAEIPLRDRQGDLRALALVDPEDETRVLAAGPWHFASGYARHAFYGGGQIWMHRFVLGLPRGRLPEVDHRNGDGLDNRRSNLRLATRSLNLQNVPSRGGSSRFRGVGFHRATGKWQAFARLNGKYVYLGIHATENAAAETAAAWRREHMPFTEEARSVYRKRPQEPNE